jgi:hypothetical protein
VTSFTGSTESLWTVTPKVNVPPGSCRRGGLDDADLGSDVEDRDHGRIGRRRVVLLGILGGGSDRVRLEMAGVAGHVRTERAGVLAGWIDDARAVGDARSLAVEVAVDVVDQAREGDRSR